MRENRLLWGVLRLGAVHTFCVTSHTLNPVFARDILNVGPTGLGLLYSASGTGSLLMSMNMMVLRGLAPLSGLQSGALASLIGAPAAIATGAALFVFYGIFLFLRVPEVYSFRQGSDKD